jgi:conjugative transfer signal peptidase TraF
MLGVLAVITSAIWEPGYALFYNPSASAPKGWYVMRPLHRAKPGDYVIAALPAPMARLAASRGYLPVSVPLLKRVGAIGGAHVCTREGRIYVDGKLAAVIRPHDGKGWAMPVWQHCRWLLHNELFLLGATESASFDSRYFGPITADAVKGLAVPLWTWNAPSQKP